MKPVHAEKLPSSIIGLLRSINDNRTAKLTFSGLSNILDKALKDEQLNQAFDKASSFYGLTPVHVTAAAGKLVGQSQVPADRFILRSTIEYIIKKSNKPELEDLFNDALELPEGRVLALFIAKVNGTNGRLGLDQATLNQKLEAEQVVAGLEHK